MSGVDRLAALPEDVLQHVLSFLPSRDAVRSAGLARRWRHLWRSTPAVRVKGSGDGFRAFVTSLLLSRDSSPLRSFEIDADLIVGENNDESYCDDEFDLREVDQLVDVWIRHAVTTCRAGSLTARFDEEDLKWTPRQPQPFASPHLTTIHLNGVVLADELLDFSCCPALLHLTLSACCLEGDALALASPSLERLRIVSCDTPMDTPNWTRMRISTPSLRYLRLSDGNSEFEFPSLESMPWLTKASIKLTSTYFKGDINSHDGDDDAGGSLLLHGLSEATSLKLITSPSDTRITLLRDLKWCPTFTKLRTLILNEWCVYADVTKLASLLGHTPRLESLTLKLPFKKRPRLELETTEGVHITSEQSFPTLEHLKTMEIKQCSLPCYFDRGVDFSERVDEILKLFRDWGIPSSKISINYKQPEGKRKRVKLN